MLMGLAAMACGSVAHACTTPVSVCSHDRPESFALIQQSQPANLLIDASADPAVRYVAESFAADLQRVSGHAPQRYEQVQPAGGNLVVIGVLGHSPVIDGLVRAGKIEASDLAGQWEAFRQIVVDHPFPHVARALVIVGADRRGAVYGTYDISEKIGVSPWYWFADVPVRQQANVFLTAGSRRDQPRVKYRGFFINDEDPSFTGWAKKHFGGINHQMYAHVFELELRLKGNFLWPAMWAPKAFNDDDPQNMMLADAMGIVMGTSHHEAMMRAQDEWHRHTDQGITGGPWNYATNGANLRTFWRGGIERMMSKGDGQSYESVVTVGMRGDGDEPMTEGTATQLLQTIVADQRKIIADVTGKPAEQTPQAWALYKEVQDYYDHGMKVPDDVTLLFADDNWGQIRRLPRANSERQGGYGVYYHFDYVGGPRNYKWINTNQIEKVWQQMNLAYARGARALWIVNVGDLKPMEFPLSFFLRQAWNPEAMTPDALAQYPDAWASATFGPTQASAIAQLITRYSQLAARRKPELIDAGSFQLGADAGDKLDGGEFGTMIAEWQALEQDMLKVKATLPPDQRDAYFQLVEHPILALSNFYQLYYAVAWNRRLAAVGDPRANVFADQAEAAFRRDQEITDAYHALNGGKWDGMMAQTHIGYSGWQQPERQVMPEVKRVTTQRVAKPIVFAPVSTASATTAKDDVISIEAPHYSRAVDGKGLSWRAIAHLGRTLGAVVALPQGHPPTSAQDGVRLEYDVSLHQSGELALQLYMVPTLDTMASGGVRMGVSVDDGAIQILTDRMTPAANGTSTQEQRDWDQAVEDNARVLRATFPDMTAGKHVIKVWRLDDNAVLQKLVLSRVPVPPSYLGPAESAGYDSLPNP
ncbi:glycosyl hydrolase 115 family protein [Dyella humicola]|uniref:glycosyl hydrolase 115 family protein n=1 Tax=Dyella humicola TaxID=2992126 RepID=UPI00225029E5|nr:glycosyl hydrolase 115 family protein [Dyella humicola]